MQTWHDSAFNQFNLNLTNIGRVIFHKKINQLKQHDYDHMATRIGFMSIEVMVQEQITSPELRTCSDPIKLC